MAFNPTADRVLIHRAPPETKTSSGLIIPDSNAEKNNQGTIISAGPGRVTAQGVLIPLSVKVGDVIMFGPGAGTPVKVDGQDYLVLKEEEIIGVVE